KLGTLREHLQACGRDRAEFGLEAWLRADTADPHRWSADADGWRRLGADIVLLYPTYRIPDLDDQIETLRRFREIAGD
ncbi:MAG: hypothetical protein GWO02_19890, partial [Gammaproteobacteria bacterium]|nr:hypothetical protein [Gammaproteobacteria bacterium]